MQREGLDPTRVNNGQTDMTSFFAGNPLSFSVLQKYPPAVVSSLQLGPFVMFRPRIFRFLFSLVPTPSLVRILVVLAPF
jgi:hypothetical protein